MTVNAKSTAAVKDNIVLDNSIGQGGYSFETIPYDISFNHVRWIRSSPIDQNARIRPVVDDVVSNDVTKGANFNFDTIALSGSRKNVMNPIVLDNRIPHDASGVIA